MLLCIKYFTNITKVPFVICNKFNLTLHAKYKKLTKEDVG